MNFLSDRHRQLADDAVDFGEHLVLHLHRLEHDQRAASADAFLAHVRDRDDHPANGAGTRVLWREAIAGSSLKMPRQRCCSVSAPSRNVSGERLAVSNYHQLVSADEHERIAA